MNSLPTLSVYDTESDNNNTKVLNMLSGMFPDSDIISNIPALLDLNNGINIIKSNTQLGEVIAHVRGNDVSVEFKGNFYQPKKD